MSELPTERQRASRFLLVVLGLLAFVAFLLVRPLLSGAIFGLVVGFLIRPWYVKLAKVTRVPKITAILVVIALCIAIDIPLIILGWELLREVQGFAAEAQSADFLPSIARALSHLGMPRDAATAFVQQAAKDAGDALHNAALPTLGFLGTLLMNTGVFLFVLYYTLTNGDRLLEWIRETLPLPRVQARRLVGGVGARMRTLFLGTFLVAIAHGTLSGIVWWLLGFPDPVFWGAVMVLLSLVPALGTGIVMFPAGAIAIAMGRLFPGATLLVWALLVAPLVDNGIRAVFVGRTSDIHPSLVLVGTVGGLALFGPSGFLLGPLFLSMIDPVLSEWHATVRGEGDEATRRSGDEADGPARTS